MKFADYFRPLEPGQKRDVARRAGTTVNYLHQVASGARRASVALARRIEKATDLNVTREDLRADLYR